MWKTIIKFPKYESNEFGEIRDIKTKRLKYIAVNKQGYKYTQFKVNGKIYTAKIHRLVAEYFLESPSEELVVKCSKEHHGKVLVKHKDNDKLNNFYKNLEWCDLKNNTAQAWDDGLIPPLRGSRNGRSVLTEDVVHELCKCFQEGMGPKEATVLFDVSRQQASKIRAGIAWKHISSLYDIKPLRD